MCWESFPLMNRILFRWVDHIVDHGSNHIVVLDSLQLDSLWSNNQTWNEWMSRSVQEFNLVVSKLVVFDFNLKLKVSWVGIVETVSTEQKLDHVSSFGSCDCCCWLESDQLYLAFDRFWFDVGIVQTIGHNSVCHLSNVFFWKLIIINNLKVWEKEKIKWRLWKISRANNNSSSSSSNHSKHLQVEQNIWRHPIKLKSRESLNKRSWQLHRDCQRRSFGIAELGQRKM